MTVVTLRDYRPSPRYDGKRWDRARLEGDHGDDAWEEIETFTLEADEDPENPATRSFTTEEASDETRFRVIFLDEDDDEQLTGPVSFPSPALASRRDVAARLGRALKNGDEEAQVDWLLVAATDLISDAAGENDEWAGALTTVPRRLRLLCVELVSRAMANPQAVASVTESLGEHSYSRTFPRGQEAGLMLNDAEERMIRRALGADGSGSARVESAVTRNFRSVGLPGDFEWIGWPASSL